MMFRGNYLGNSPYPYLGQDTGPSDIEVQASAEFNEALGQLGTAAQLYFNAHLPPIGIVPGHGRKRMNQRDKELAAHKIREAITNLQDVVRFMELP